MKIKQKGFILLFILFFYTFVSAKTGYEFLKVSPSPDCSALGDACSSLHNNASSFYYNPALLCFDFPKFTSISPNFKTIDLYFSYIKYFLKMNYISFFSVMDIKTINRIGIGFTGFFYGNMEPASYEGERYSTENKINIGAYSFLIGYGYNITDKIGVGVNVKLPIEKLGDKTSLGIGGDIGGIYKQKTWNASLVIQNIGYDIKNIEKSHCLPMTVKIGGNYGFYLFKKTYPKIHKIIITADIGREIEKDFMGGIGLQYSFNKIIFARNGYFIKKDKIDIRLGCGFKYKDYQIDYGYSLKDLGNIHRIGFGMKFDISEKDIETEQTKEGIVIRISEDNTILFEYNKANFKKDAYRILNKVIDILKTKKEKEILISGHTDSIGGDELNLKLSKKRAEAVCNYFIRKGIKKQRMKNKGYGEKQPIASNKTEKGKAKNRRVDIILLRLSKKEKEKFDYHFYSGLDCYYKEGYKLAIDEWEKALKIDPENEKVEEWIKKAEKK